MAFKYPLALVCAFAQLTAIGCQRVSLATIKGTAYACPADGRSQVLAGNQIKNLPNAIRLQGVTVQLSRVDNGILIDEVNTDSQGNFTFTTECESGVLLRILYFKDGYEKCERQFTFGPMSNFLDSHARMVPSNKSDE